MIAANRRIPDAGRVIVVTPGQLQHDHERI